MGKNTQENCLIQIIKEFVLAYDNTAGSKQVSVASFKMYFLPRVETENYNIETEGRNFYDQPINDSTKQ